MSTFGAGPSSSLTITTTSPHPQAEPLPRKIAEFGYVATTEADSNPNPNPYASTLDLALRPHPAERSRAGTPSTSGQNDVPTRPPPSPGLGHGSNPSAGSSTSSLPTLASINSRKRSKVYYSCINFLRGKHSSESNSNLTMPLIWGIELPTLIRLLFTVVILIGVIIGWALTIMLVSKNDDKNNSPRQGSVDDGGIPISSNNNDISGQSIIFIHTGFGVVTLILLVLLERAVYIARADRYASLHPNSTRRRGRDGRGGVAIAPWNRPPLPTYANAVGFRGTGDVEDVQIAGAPPPEYGNTRGSTLLLSTFFTPPAEPNTHSASDNDQIGEDPRGRPVSYTSHIDAPGTLSVPPITQPDRAAAGSRMSVRVEQDARRAMIALAALESDEQTTPSATSAAAASSSPRIPPPASLRPIRTQ